MAVLVGGIHIERLVQARRHLLVTPKSTRGKPGFPVRLRLLVVMPLPALSWPGGGEEHDRRTGAEGVDKNIGKLWPDVLRDLDAQGEIVFAGGCPGLAQVHHGKLCRRKTQARPWSAVHSIDRYPGSLEC